MNSQHSSTKAKTALQRMKEMERLFFREMPRWPIVTWKDTHHH